MRCNVGVIFMDCINVGTLFSNMKGKGKIYFHTSTNTFINKYCNKIIIIVII